MLFVCIAPIVALVRTARTQKMAEDAEAKAETLRKRVECLEAQLQKSGELKATPSLDPPPPLSPPPPLPDAVVMAPVVEKTRQETDSADALKAGQGDDRSAVLSQVSAASVNNGIAEPPAIRQEPEKAAKVPFDWENFFGAKLFAWMGGVALFLGIVYLIIESFQRSWIPPVVRVCIGAAVGLGLIAGGVRFRNTVHRTTMQTFTGTGVVILFAVIYTCRAIYHFEVFTAAVTFVLMAGVAAAAFFLAGFMRAQVVAVLGLLAGFAIPVLVSTGQDRPVVLFVYLAVLTVTVLAAGGRYRWPLLSPLAGAGFGLLFAGWYVQFGHEAAVYGKSPAVWIPLAAAFLFPLFHLAGAWVVGRAGVQDDKKTDGAAVTPMLPEVGVNMVGTAMMLSFVPVFLCGYWLCVDFWKGETVLMLVCLFAAGLPALAGAILQKSSGTVVSIVTLLTMGALGLWISFSLTPDSLWMAMWAVVVFALLHGVGPLLLQRRGWLCPSDDGTHFATVGGLLLALVLLWTMPVPVSVAMVWILVLSGGAVALGVAKKSAVISVAVLVLGVACFAGMLRKPVWETYSGYDIWWWLAAVCIFAGGFIVAGIRGIVVADAETPEKAKKWEGMLYISCVMPYLLLLLVVSNMAGGREVFGALAALGLILVVAANWLRAPMLLAVALAGTLLVEYLNLAQWNLEAGQDNALIFCWSLGLALAFTVAPLAGWRRWRESAFSWGVAALALPLSYFLLRKTAYFWLPNEAKGLLPLLLVLPGAAVFVFLFKKSGAANPARVSQLAWMGGSALFFVTLVFPVQFESQWLTLGWALEAVALCGLMRRVPHGGLGATALGLLAVVLARLVVVPGSSPWLGGWEKGGAALFNVHLYTYGVAAACFACAAWWLEGGGPKKWWTVFGIASRVLRAAAVLLLFLLVNIEIADYFTPAEAGHLALDVTGNWHGKTDFARGMSFTLAWGVFALCLVGAGLWRKAALARWVGLALLGVTLGKVFLFDLAGLENLYRVAVLLGTAVVAIVASLLYQRFLRMTRE
ncbi:MAG: DUF2339 domain-containing protein [Puniceicoccales bacterium]|nr:DUF2339 domain-containing protein [Puniceicoccales bacterium]